MRNYLLATRVMWHLECSAVSYPPLPPTHLHPLWEARSSRRSSTISALSRSAASYPLELALLHAAPLVAKHKGQLAPLDAQVGACCYICGWCV